MSVEVHHEHRVAVITLNRPEKRNALRAIDAKELAAAVADLACEPIETRARAILIRGEGPAFSAGADLSGDVYDDDFFDSIEQMITALLGSPIPVIADVQGPAVGAGCQIVLACDLRVVGESAVFWVPNAQHGFALDGWTHSRAKELLGGGLARNLFLGGARVGADQAVASGFAIEKADSDGAMQLAQRIAAQAPLSMEHSKRMLNSADPEMDSELSAMIPEIWASEDVREARAARAEKRPPEFRGI